MVLESCAKLHKLETKLKVKLRQQLNLKLNVIFLVKIENYFYFISIVCFHAPYILIYAILYFLYGYSVSSTFKSYNCWRFDIIIAVLNINAIVGKEVIF